MDPDRELLQNGERPQSGPRSNPDRGHDHAIFNYSGIARYDGIRTPRIGQCRDELTLNLGTLGAGEVFSMGLTGSSGSVPRELDRSPNRDETVADRHRQHGPIAIGDAQPEGKRLTAPISLGPPEKLLDEIELGVRLFGPVITCVASVCRAVRGVTAVLNLT